MSKRAKEAVEYLKRLVDNWDSYGAKKFDPEFCDVLKIHLEEIEDVGYFDWSLEPGTDGKSVILTLDTDK